MPGLQVAQQGSCRDARCRTAARDGVSCPPGRRRRRRTSRPRARVAGHAAGRHGCAGSGRHPARAQAVAHGSATGSGRPQVRGGHRAIPRSHHPRRPRAHRQSRDATRRPGGVSLSACCTRARRTDRVSALPRFSPRRRPRRHAQRDLDHRHGRVRRTVVPAVGRSRPATLRRARRRRVRAHASVRLLADGPRPGQHAADPRRTRFASERRRRADRRSRVRIEPGP